MMRNKLLFISILLFWGFVNQAFSQKEYYGNEANKILNGCDIVRTHSYSEIPSYMRFRPEYQLPVDKLNDLLYQKLMISPLLSYAKVSEIIDNRDELHVRYVQTYQNMPIRDAVFIVHIKNNKITSINGTLLKKFNALNSSILSEEQALQSALTYVNAQRYKWQMKEEEALLKKETNNSEASYYPKGKLEYLRKPQSDNYVLAYKFDIYADKPLKRADIYVDAENAEIIFENNKIYHIDTLGTAVTKFSGVQPITTDYTGSVFRLRETGRGQGVETYNMLTSTNYGNAVDFTDSDNYWNNVNSQKDEIATDAHWGAEKTWDYYWYKFERNSIDNLGFKLKSYVHYDVNYANAFWDGQRMTYGDGNSSMQPLVALDICAHEITHGLTSFTANLDYSYESGALNEAFSDIFGTAIEFYAKPQAANWLIGENIGNYIRSMSNPNAKSQPDTYLGTYWYSGPNDNGGVHTNSGVLNYWFYLLYAGGAGTNDNNQTFNVSGIGIDSAEKIAYRMLTVYLTNSSNYSDARFYGIISATDLFGSCSQAVNSTTNAFYAVGLGNSYVPGVQSNFTADFTTFCQLPATVTFTNQSNNGASYLWDFGDGTYSTDLNPVHVYQNFGNFNVKLIANGGLCGIDSLTKTQYISVDPQNPCLQIMPANGNAVSAACSGTLLDNGGSSNYLPNSNSYMLISPLGASSVTLTFSQFNLESGYDYLYIYNGNSTSSPLIGQYSGTNLPNGGTIVANSGSVLLYLSTDSGVENSGFVINWQCSYPNLAPIANFSVSDTISCTGKIKFTDLSLYGASSWLWDFGDGNTSNQQHPIHNYTSNGVYSVKLVCTNIIGSDSVIKSNIININKPLDPVKPNDVESCGASSFTLTASGNGKIKWFDSPTSTFPIDTGTTFITPVYQSSTTIYVESQEDGPDIFGGKPNNSGGGGYFNNTNIHYLVFDCTQATFLKSVKVYAASAGNRTITLRTSSGSVLASKTVNIPSGESRVDLNFYIPVMNNLQLEGPANPNLYRNNAGTNYPYIIGNSIKIKSSSATQNPTGYYYYFYDWQIEGEKCVSNRLPVNIYINYYKPVPSFTYYFNNLTVTFNNNTANGGINYLWDFGDGTTSMDKNPVHNYQNFGSYVVKLISYNACGADSVSETVNVVQGIEPIRNLDNKIIVYPNPADNIISIKFDYDKSVFAKLKFTDILGREVEQKDLHINSESNTYQFDISRFSKGIYFVNINVDNINFTSKFVKK